MFGSDEEITTQIPNQAQSVVKGSGEGLVSEYKPVPDVDYLQMVTREKGGRGCRGRDRNMVYKVLVQDVN
ncbi:hypothetical protein NMG60_11029020 [Bertholletia excelsa]